MVRGKYALDVVGHYARPDIFQLHVDRCAKQPVIIHEIETAEKERPAAPANVRPVSPPLMIDIFSW